MDNLLNHDRFVSLGRDAASASRDPHDKLVGAAMAYDFITTMANEDDPLAVPACDALPTEYKIGFLEGYYHEEDLDDATTNLDHRPARSASHHGRPSRGATSRCE